MEFVTKLDWKPADGEDAVELGKKLIEEKHIHPQTHCGVCHR
jgi:hypothetical protein